MKTGFIGLIGLPNAGKSTLVNAIVGEKVGIVSSKPQTTRQRVVGILTEPDMQICFVDSPGHVRATTGLNQFLEKELASVTRNADLLMAVLNVDAKRMEDLIKIVEYVKSAGKPWMAVITKVDLDPGHRAAKLREYLSGEGIVTVAGSALKNSPRIREILLTEVKPLLPESDKYLFDPEMYTTQNLRNMLAELVREKCFENLHQEIPFGLAVKTTRFIEEDEPVMKANVEILVNKDNHLAMVVGRGGQMLKNIGQSARLEFERMTGRRLHLETYVKVRRDWAKSPEHMRDLGYVVTE